MLAHELHDVGRCDRLGIWESFKNSADSIPMVSMTVCNVDGCQVLTSCRNPICQSIGLLDRHKGIHQDGVPHAIDEGGRHRLKMCLSYAGRPVASDNGYARRHEHVPVQKSVFRSLFHHHVSNAPRQIPWAYLSRGPASSSPDRKSV